LAKLPESLNKVVSLTTIVIINNGGGSSSSSDI
jgi:hypothetical protein